MPVSAIEHYAYCPRQCALIHVEQAWDENIYTMRGRDVHEGVHEDSSHLLEGVRYERALPIWSTRLNLVGKADLVEFRNGVPYPVEYKSGKRKRGHPESLQLCTQAMCLEEMFGVEIMRGAIYWHGSRERKEVVFAVALRQKVEEIAAQAHHMIARHHVPPPVNDRRCDDCSLKESCLPHVVGDRTEQEKLTSALFRPD